MRFFLVVTLSAFMGCGPQPAPGLSCPLEPSPDAVELSVEGLEATVILQGPTVVCAGNELSATLELIDPDGARQSVPAPPFSKRQAFNALGNGLGEVFVASFPLLLDKPGRWAITAAWSTGGTSTSTLHAARRVETGPWVLRRFVDRMDMCLRGPFRTNAGLTACQRADGEIWIYSLRGEVRDHFPGSQLAVRGDEIWSWREPGELEHRTALVDSVRFDGAVPLIGGGAEGPTKPNLVVRGESSRIQEVSWDGTALTSRTIAEGYRFPSRFVIAQGSQTWSGEGCLVERGCSQTLCDPVSTCRMPTENLLAIDDQAIWFLRTGLRGEASSLFPLVANLRPLETDRVEGLTVRLLVRDDPSTSFLSSGVTPMLELPRILKIVDSVVIPRVKDHELDFVALETPGTLVTMTEDWMVSVGADRFTLLATPTPALQ